MRRSKTVRQQGGPEATRQRILDAALNVFAQKGFHQAIVDDIVAASDTSKGAFYFHFPNKNGVFLALVDLLAHRLEDKVQRAIAHQQGSIAKIDAALETVLEVFSRHRRLAKVLLIDIAGLGHSFNKKYLEVRSRFVNLIKAQLDGAVQDGSLPAMDTELTALMWMGAINEVVVHWLYTGQPKPLTAAFPQLRSLLLGSLGIQPAEGHRGG